MRQIDLYDLIVFDWDGTLLDSPNKISECIVQAANQCGLEISLEQARSIIGLKLDHALRQLFPDLSSAELLQLNQAYHEVFRKHPLRTPLLPGCLELLQWLKSFSRLHLAVATGKSRTGLDRELNEYQLKDFFGYTRCAEESASKPDPQMLIDIMNFTGIAAERTLMVGDTSFDLVMAKNAGVRSVALACGAHPVKMMQGLGAQVILARLDQVKDWLSSTTIAE